MMARLLIVLLAVVILTQLYGCASTPAPQTALVPVSVCAVADELPEPPARVLQLEGEAPGIVAKEVLANRSRWIGYADALRALVEGTK